MSNRAGMGSIAVVALLIAACTETRASQPASGGGAGALDASKVDPREDAGSLPDEHDAAPIVDASDSSEAGWGPDAAVVVMVDAAAAQDAGAVSQDEPEVPGEEVPDGEVPGGEVPPTAKPVEPVLCAAGPFTFPGLPLILTEERIGSLAAGDFNRDGRADLALPDRSLALALGRGDGTFETHRVDDDPQLGASLLVHDLDLDGQLDLVVTHHGASEARVLLGNSDGTFTQAGAYRTPAGPHSTTSADLNGDGWPDLSIAGSSYENGGSSGVSVLLNQQDGTFSNEPGGGISTGGAAYSSAWAVTAADLDGDALADLAVTNSGSEDVTVLISAGDGTFAHGRNYALGGLPVVVVAADFDQDGDLDLATGNHQAKDVTLLRNRGAGHFDRLVRIPIGTSIEALTAVDLNGDGRPELIAGGTWSGFAISGISVLPNLGHGMFGAPVRYPGGGGTIALATSDFNADGAIDLAAADFHGGAAHVLLNRGDGTLRSPGSSSVGLSPVAVAFGDVDADGSLDLVTANSGSDDICVVANDGGDFHPAYSRAAGRAPRALTLADFDGDGEVDLAAASAEGVSVLLQEEGMLAPATTFACGNGPSAVASGDLDGNDTQDLIVANQDGNDLSILLNPGDGMFAEATRVPSGMGPVALALADFDRDGATDVAVANAGSADVTVSFNDGAGVLTRASTYPAGTRPGALTTGDFNRDGAPDLAIADTDGDLVRTLLNAGDGTLVLDGLHAVGRGPSRLTVADMNHDGQDDLVALNATSLSVTVLLGRGDGAFVRAGDFASAVSAGGLAAADLDGDGVAELAVTSPATATVHVLAGRCGEDLDASATPVRFPAAATMVAGVASSPSQIDLVWQDNASDEHGYLLERDDGRGYTPVALLAANSTLYHDAGLEPDRVFVYRVLAYNPGGYSNYTPLTLATPAEPGESRAWAKRYSGAYGATVNALVPAARGGYIIVGALAGTSSTSDGWLARLASTGALSFSKAIGDEYGMETLRSVHATSDGGFVLTGARDFRAPPANAWVMKMNANGEVEWQRRFGYGDAPNDADDIIQTDDDADGVADDGYALLGYELQGTLRITKMTGTGTLQWDSQVMSVSTAKALRQKPDGSYVAVGEQRLAGSTRGWIGFFAQHGPLVSQVIVENASTTTISDLEITADGGVLIAGAVNTATGPLTRFEGWLLKLDRAGRVQWQKTYSVGGDERFDDVVLDEDGGYLVAGSVVAPGALNRDLWLVGVDADGDVRFEQRIGGADDESGARVARTPEGGYLLAGVSWPAGVAPAETAVWVVKLDANRRVSFTAESTAVLAATSARITADAPLSLTPAPELGRVVATNTSNVDTAVPSTPATVTITTQSVP